MLGSMNLPAGPCADHGSGDAESDAARRRRLDEIFGDVLPDVTRDERETGQPGNDGWYLDNRPPHHG